MNRSISTFKKSGFPVSFLWLGALFLLCTVCSAAFAEEEAEAPWLGALFLLCTVCSAAFAEEEAEAPFWDPNWENLEYVFETEGDEYESTRMRISRIAKTQKWDLSLPNFFGNNEIKLRDKEEDVIPKLDALPYLIKAAEPVRWTKDIRHSADDKKSTYHYSLHCYTFTIRPNNCIILFFSNDEYGLERFDFVKRDIPFSAGEEFFLYPNVYPENDWKQDLALWNAMSEYEQYFCMLSSPLISYNLQEVCSVNPEPILYNPETVKKSQFILERDWDCHSRNDILNVLESYRTGEDGYVQMYDRLYQLFAKHPGKTVEQISALECLDIRDTVRLFFIMQMGKKIGEHGMLAWDNGRLLTILRWGIAAGWLSEHEAMQYARPLIDKILNSYASWEDYLAHYTIGRGLFALSQHRDIDKYQYDALRYPLNYALHYENPDKAHQLSFHGTVFPAENQNGNPVLTYNDVWYKPSADAKVWAEIYAISEKNPHAVGPDDEKKLMSFYNKKKSIPCIALQMLVQRESKGFQSEKLMKYYDAAAAALSKIVPEKRGINSECDMYVGFYYLYIMKSLAVKDYKRLYTALSQLDDENTTDDTMCVLYALYYYVKMKNEKNQKKFEQYKQKALGFASRLVDDGEVLEHENADDLFDIFEKILRETDFSDFFGSMDFRDFRDFSM